MHELGLEGHSAAGWRRLRLLGVMAVLVGVVVAPPISSTIAAFTDAPGVDVTATADRLDPPTGVTCAGGLVICNATVLSRPQLTWTASADSYAAGYRVLRSTTSGSGYVVVATLPGRTTTSWTDTGTVTPLTTYYYVVEAYAGTWTSVRSPQVAVTVVA